MFSLLLLGFFVPPLPLSLMPFPCETTIVAFHTMGRLVLVPLSSQGSFTSIAGPDEIIHLLRVQGSKVRV